jgi:peptide chain release factor
MPPCSRKSRRGGDRSPGLNAVRRRATLGGVSVWLQVSAGRGPAECTWVVPRLVAVMLAEASAAGVVAECIEQVAGEAKGTLRSALVELGEGPCESFAAGWVGSALWVGRSPFRPEHRRRNWFVQVSEVTPREDEAPPSWRAEELEVTAMRAGGPGGQHVNTRSTAVRVRHLPSGLEAVGRGERSQRQNHAAALARLRWLLGEQAAQRREQGERAMWDAKGEVQRGDPRRVFRGPEFVAG